MTKSDEIIIVVDNLSTKKSNTIATNVMSTASINYYSKEVRDCYMMNTVLLVIILLLIVTIICYKCTKQRYKLNWKTVENCACYYLKGFDLDHILIEEKP